jgi:hypothetical protein
MSSSLKRPCGWQSSGLPTGQSAIEDSRATLDCESSAITKVVYRRVISDKLTRAPAAGDRIRQPGAA